MLRDFILIKEIDWMGKRTNEIQLYYLGQILFVCHNIKMHQVLLTQGAME